jgi:hypothetical protein
VNAEQIAAISALVVAVVTALASYNASRSRARIDEVALLREEVKRLHEHQDKLESRIDELQDENLLLYRILRKHGLDIEQEIIALRRLPDTRKTKLAASIVRQFSREEINGLAFAIGIDPDDVTGDSQDERARQLVLLAERRGLFDALEAEVSKQR